MFGADRRPKRDVSNKERDMQRAMDHRFANKARACETEPPSSIATLESVVGSLLLLPGTRLDETAAYPVANLSGVDCFYCEVYLLCTNRMTRWLPEYCSQ